MMYFQLTMLLLPLSILPYAYCQKNSNNEISMELNRRSGGLLLWGCKEVTTLIVVLHLGHRVVWYLTRIFRKNKGAEYGGKIFPKKCVYRTHRFTGHRKTEDNNRN